MVNRGHEITIIARDKEVTVHLLHQLGLSFELFAPHKKSLSGKFLEIPINDLIFYRAHRRSGSEISTGINDYCSAHVGFITRTPSIIFTDTEDVRFGDLSTFPFASTICTPSGFLRDLGKKQVRYQGYHELAYLHPNYFTPDPQIFDDLGISKDEKFIIVRFISWAASHDIHLKGIRDDSALDFVRNLEKYGRVYISSEKPLKAELSPYRLTLPPEKMHSLMYHAQLYIGEGGTMAAEAALLGTPSIHIESDAGGRPTGSYCGNFLELRNKYGLLYFYANQNEALEKATKILGNPGSKTEWAGKREKLLKDKIDVTSWMTTFFENYPRSIRHEQKGTRDHDIH
jgi:predicted glycosyltransferase